MTTPQRYPLAPMSRSILALTILLWLLPLSFLAHFLLTRQPFTGWIALTLLLTYGAVWAFCRPSRFELSTAGLRIVFPGWTRTISRRDMNPARPITASEFKEDFGLALRIGAGGLWGGFGWLWTSKGGFVEFYVSRTEGMVLLKKKNGNFLLLTPERPEAFAALATDLSGQ